MWRAFPCCKPRVDLPRGCSVRRKHVAPSLPVVDSCICFRRWPGGWFGPTTRNPDAVSSAAGDQDESARPACAPTMPDTQQPCGATANSMMSAEPAAHAQAIQELQSQLTSVMQAINERLPIANVGNDAWPRPSVPPVPPGVERTDANGLAVPSRVPPPPPPAPRAGFVVPPTPPRVPLRCRRQQWASASGWEPVPRNRPSWHMMPPTHQCRSCGNVAPSRQCLPGIPPGQSMQVPLGLPCLGVRETVGALGGRRLRCAQHHSPHIFELQWFVVPGRSAELCLSWFIKFPDHSRL